jgi:hypothetical protein
VPGQGGPPPVSASRRARIAAALTRRADRIEHALSPRALAVRVRAWPALLAAHLRALPRRLAGFVLRLIPPCAAGAAASIPVIVSTVHAARAGWEPDGDDGIILTRALDVFTSHSPLIGQYSEAGNVTGQIVHSPGPMLYWLLSIPVRLGGPASAAIAMGVVSSLCIVGCVILARRRGGHVLMIATAIGIALMCQSLYAEVFHDVWNPSAAMFPFLLEIFICWSVAAGDYRLLPALVIVASFVTQTHLTYLAPTLAIVAVAIAGLTATRLLDRRQARIRGLPPPRRVVWRWILVATLALGLCWSAPIIDELEHSPGNLSLIATTVHDRGRTLGPRVGYYAVVRAVGVTPWFLFVPRSEWNRKRSVRETPSGGQTASALALLAALALIAVAAALRRRIDLAAAALIGLGMCLGLGADAANTPDNPLLSGTLGYTMWWGSQLGLWVWLTVAWSLYNAARAALPRLLALAKRTPPAPPRRALVAATASATLAGIIATAAVGQAVANTEKPDSHVREYAPTTAIGRAIVAALPPGVSIDYELGPLDLATQPIEPAIRFWLVKHGDRPLADGSLPRLGSYYQLNHRHYSWIVWLGNGTTRRPHLRLVARVRFRDQWGAQTLSAWVGRAPPPATRARKRVK